MLLYVKTLDELVELVDKEFSSINAVCPICKNKVGSVNIPNIELGLEEFKFTQFTQSGIYCTEGHCLIVMEEDNQAKKQIKNLGVFRIYIDDLGLKVFEVMQIIKKNLDVDESIPNTQLYWMLMNKDEPLSTRALPYEDAYNLLDKIQSMGARAHIV